MARLTVLGTGYLGATHAVCMAELGHEVLGVDVDREKVASLASGRVPFYEPGLEDLLSRHLASGRLRFSPSYQDAAAFGDVHFVCVGTPQRADGNAADLSYVDAAVRSLAPHLHRPALVVGKSTVPVGTARRLARILAVEAPVGARAEVAWNPEFLREGTAVQDTLFPDRIVAGVGSRWAEDLLRAVYAPLTDRETPFLTMDFATAELVKVAANAFLATKVSYVNAMAEICEVAGADVLELARALGLDQRVGPGFLSPGLGFGGGCLPKDIRAFMARAEELGAGRSLAFLAEVDSINRRRPRRVVELALGACGGSVAGRRVAIWGAAFKPHSDDIRGSQALVVAEALSARGAEVTVHDPKGMDNARKQYPELTYAQDPVQAAIGADVVLHLTEWPEFAQVDPEEIAAVATGRSVIDGRLTLDPVAWRAAGWVYTALGRAHEG